jgi:hypothetical protein
MNLPQMDASERAMFALAVQRLITLDGMGAEQAIAEAGRRREELKKADLLMRGPDSAWFCREGTKK